MNVRERDRVEAGDALVELENDLEKLRVDESAAELERLKKIKDDVATQEQVDRADFAHRRAKVDYDRTFIRAPFPGFIAGINARVGEMTFGSMALAIGSSKAAQDPLIYLVDDSELHIEADIDESDVSRVRPGQSAKVTFSGLERRVLPARVSTISPIVSTNEGESRTAEVKAQVDPIACAAPEDGAGSQATPAANDPVVLVGMSADLEILVERAEDVVRVPTTAILERGEDRYVFVVVSGDLSQRPITVGLGNWDMTEVKSGLSPGDLVATPTDARILKEGEAVRAVVDDSRPSGR